MPSKLPYPPTDKEKLLYTDPNPGLFFISGFVGLVVFSFCSYHFISKSIWVTPYVIFCICYFANIGFCTFGSLFAKKFDLLQHSLIKSSQSSYCPSVDIFLPSCGEPLELLANNYKAIKEINYPNFQVHILDDAGRDDLKILSEMMGFNYISRPNKGEMKKSGNMRYAFSKTNGELILVFDADFTPRKDFLKETVAYFGIDPNLAILQTPQYFRINNKQSPIEQGATYLQEVFHRLIQNFRNSWGASVCTGSCAVYRRKALEPIGGSYPVERSEDVNTGLYVLREGWNIKYLPLVLSAGLSPDTIEAFFNQHYRWCAGSIKLVTSKLFWTQPNVGFLGKFSYLLSILYYCTSGLGIFCFSVPTLINVWFFPHDFDLSNYSLIFPTIILVSLIRAKWARNPFNLSPLIAAFSASYTHAIALLDVLTGDIAPWIPTGAIEGSRKVTRFDRFKLLLAIVPPLQLALLLSGLIYRNISYTEFSLALFWLCFQIFLQFCVVWHIKEDFRRS